MNTATITFKKPAHAATQPIDCRMLIEDAHKMAREAGLPVEEVYFMLLVAGLVDWNESKRSGVRLGVANANN